MRNRSGLPATIPMQLVASITKERRRGSDPQSETFARKSSREVKRGLVGTYLRETMAKRFKFSTSLDLEKSK